MKKGLSILLVAAALFGFYGGAANLNDVLACKDYWEKAGEESTANMNKLEDGLNQLKENEAAYLDGKDQLAEGEKALADGEAQYAQGLADYEAAPGKLADGEKKIAAGEKKLADGYSQYNQGKKDLKAGKTAVAKGKKDLASLNTLIDGIEQVLKGYPTFKNGYAALRQGRIDTLGKVPELAPTLQQVGTLLSTEPYSTVFNTQAALQGLGQANQLFEKQNPSSFTNDQYGDFNTALNGVKTALTTAKPILEAIDSEVVATMNGPVAEGKTLDEVKNALQTPEKDLGYALTKGGMPKEDGSIGTWPDGVPDTVKAEAWTKYGAAAKNAMIKKMGEVLTANKEKFTTLVTNFSKDDLPKLGDVSTAVGTAAAKGDSAYENASDVADAIVNLKTVLGNVHNSITGFKGMIDQYAADKTGLLSQWIDGYAQITSPDTQNSLKTLVGGVAQIIGGVLDSGNDELINGLNAVAKQVGFKATDFTPATSSKLAKDLGSDSALENFYNDMNKVEKGFQTVLPSLKNKAKTGASDLAAGEKAVAEGEKKLAAAKKQLAKGEKDLAAGKAELAQGKADYAAAPGKLADAEKQLAEGRQTLADGKAKLAEYEDGEQQVRDGLATLAGTEADLSLKSILDRLNGDDDFDNGDNHLELDEGLAAVEVGRGYQAEDGVLITEEIMARAVGTGALLGAGALAVLAAILSFLKKNKAAGVFAVLAAAAGAFGAFYGTQAGTYFSSIAGSTVGATGWIAAGILGAVALVHAIVHFTAGKEA